MRIVYFGSALPPNARCAEPFARPPYHRAGGLRAPEMAGAGPVVWQKSAWFDQVSGDLGLRMQAQAADRPHALRIHLQNLNLRDVSRARPCRQMQGQARVASRAGRTRLNAGQPNAALIERNMMAERLAAAGTVMIHAAMIVMKCDRRTSLRRRLSSGA